jgi:hypothetical protein
MMGRERAGRKSCALLSGKRINHRKNIPKMYSLAPESGGRMTAPIPTKETELFQRYIQSVERTADLISSRLSELLDLACAKFYGEALWQHELASMAGFLAEEGTGAMDEIAPEDYEGLISFYKLYGHACSKTADAIYDFLEGTGTEAGMREGFVALEAHNAARDVYLTGIDFPAWLL